MSLYYPKVLLIGIAYNLMTVSSPLLFVVLIALGWPVGLHCELNGSDVASFGAVSNETLSVDRPAYFTRPTSSLQFLIWRSSNANRVNALATREEIGAEHNAIEAIELRAQVRYPTTSLIKCLIQRFATCIYVRYVVGWFIAG
jgi:hypothetical protein